MSITLDSVKDQDKNVMKFARFGMFAKGVVYVILGVLTAMAAFNVGGEQATGKSGALEFVYSQPFGKFMLALVALGLLGYVVWRWIQAFKDPEADASDDEKKRGVKRVGYFISGLTYGFIAFEAGRMVFSGGSSGGSGGSSQKQSLVAQILEMPAGQWIIGLIAAILFGKAIYQFWKSLSGEFDKKVQDSGELDQRVKSILHKAGFVGYLARGVVVGIIGYFFLKAALQSDSGEVEGTKGAFEFIGSMTAGPWLLGIVAIGLACYGVFMFVKARYRVMPSSV